ncbi:hypothetical protein ALP32_200120 [Pseudomonas avellanae]|uniref:Uncharacterized protein n=1 Tax=Pseudomonas avellanae TaxID=46257 RepID=A0A3M5T3Y4_9PSED|nr:hypothetical protein ALP32_200120 [Pseudomonas avellanae]
MGFRIRCVAPVEISIRIIEDDFLVTVPFLVGDVSCFFVFFPIPPRHQIRSIQPLIHPLTQPRLHRLIRSPRIVHTMQKDHHARQVGGHFHFAGGVEVGDQSCVALGNGVLICTVHYAPPLGVPLRNAETCA